MKKFLLKIKYGYNCLKDKYNKLSETNKILVKFFVVLGICALFLITAKCCA